MVKLVRTSNIQTLLHQNQVGDSICFVGTLKTWKVKAPLTFTGTSASGVVMTYVWYEPRPWNFLSTAKQGKQKCHSGKSFLLTWQVVQRVITHWTRTPVCQNRLFPTCMGQSRSFQELFILTTVKHYRYQQIFPSTNNLMIINESTDLILGIFYIFHFLVFTRSSVFLWAWWHIPVV